jgi:hypothetical protein
VHNRGVDVWPVVALSAGLVPGTTSYSPLMDLDKFDIDVTIC